MWEDKKLQWTALHSAKALVLMQERGGGRQRELGQGAGGNRDIHHPLISSGQRPQTPCITGPLKYSWMAAARRVHDVQQKLPLLFVLLWKYWHSSSPLCLFSDPIVITL